MPPTIAVTAATGNLGRLVVDALLERVPAEQVVAIVRDPAKAEPLAAKGVEIRVATYDDDPEALAQALRGVDRLLLVSGTDLGRRVGQHTNVVEAAKQAGVSHIAYTSAPRADTSDLVLAPEHKGTEEVVRASGIPFTILRNNWYSENYAATAAEGRDTGVIITSTDGGRVASATRADFAAGAAAVLTGSGHEGAVYELGGDEAWSFDEFAATLAEIVGRPVEHRNVSREERIAGLTEAGAPEPQAQFVAALEANIADGALAETTGDLSRLIGRPTTPLRETLRDMPTR